MAKVPSFDYSDCPGKYSNSKKCVWWVFVLLLNVMAVIRYEMASLCIKNTQRLQSHSP